MASSVLISVGVNKIKTSPTRNPRLDATSATTSATPPHHRKMPRYSSFTEQEEPDTPERMSSNSSEPEEIPHASILALPDLEALLAQQDQRSRDALASALAKKKEVSYRSIQLQSCGLGSHSVRRSQRQDQQHGS